MLTGLDHWNCNILDASVQSCSDLLLQRAPTQNLFYTEHLARLTVELLEANMLLCHFVVLGNVYGGKGFDFSSVLW